MFSSLNSRCSLCRLRGLSLQSGTHLPQPVEGAHQLTKRRHVTLPPTSNPMATIHSLAPETLSLILHFASNYPPPRHFENPWTRREACRNAELKKCALVCSTWRDAALPLLYRVVSLGTESAAKAYCERRNKGEFQMRDLELHMGLRHSGRGVSLPTGQEVLEGCEGLQRLRIVFVAFSLFPKVSPKTFMPGTLESPKVESAQRCSSELSFLQISTSSPSPPKDQSTPSPSHLLSPSNSPPSSSADPFPQPSSTPSSPPRRSPSISSSSKPT